MNGKKESEKYEWIIVVYGVNEREKGENKGKITKIYTE